MTPQCNLFKRGAGLLTLALAWGLLGALWPSPVEGAEHPVLDVTQVDMIPKRGWGVSGQDPASTQTETLDNLVWDMIQSGDKMFVAGAFLNVQNGRQATPIPQPYLAAFDVATGEWVDTFRPTFDRAIYALDVLPNGSVLVGGEFETVNGVTRRGLVALDPNTAAIDPSFDGAVDRPWSSRRATIRDIEVESETGHIYVAGNFSHLEGAGGSRTRVSKAARFLNDIAVIDASWKPIVSGGAVWGMDTHPATNEVALSGFFTSVNGEANTGHFHVVDRSTGATVPGKIELVRNATGQQPEMFDTMYGEDMLLVIGEQHVTQVLDINTHRMLGFHATGYTSGFRWAGGFAGGAYQSGDRIGDFIILGCHCTNAVNNYYESFTGSRATRHNVMAIDARTGRFVRDFHADVDSPRDGHWAAASDTNGCLWLGGDYHVGGNEAGTPRWLGGFARLCTPIPPITVTQIDDQLHSVGDTVSLQIEAAGGRNATFTYSATELPSGLRLDSTTGIIEGTIEEIGFANVEITVENSTGEGIPGTQSFQWAVMDDQAPTLLQIPRRTVLVGSEIEIQPIATDAEGSVFTWSATGLPSEMTIDPRSGTITNGSPPQVGDYNVTVTVTDLVGLTDSTSFDLRVQRAKQSAAVTWLTGYQSRTTANYFLGWRFTVDEPMQLSELGLIDGNWNGRLDNRNRTYAALYTYGNGNESPIATVEIPSNTQAVDGAFFAELPTPVSLVPGVTYAVAATYSGETFLSRASTVVTASGINRVGGAYTSGTVPSYPRYRSSHLGDYFGGTFRIADFSIVEVDPVPDRSSIAGTPESLTLSARNPGGEPLTWIADGLPDGLTLDAGTGIISGTPTTPGIFTVSVTANNPEDIGDTTSFVWTVSDSVPPTLVDIASQRVELLAPISIPTPVTDPEPGLVWSATGLAPGVTIDPSTGLISGAATTEGVFTVTVTVADPAGLTDTQTFALTVVEPGTDSLLDPGSRWRYNDSGTDLGNSWRESSFDDRSWQQGLSEFGFGDADETTLWAPGSTTYYARAEFEFDGAVPPSLQLDLKADDGAIVYLNGVEILRDNLPPGPIDFQTTADDWRSGAAEDFVTHQVASEPLVRGTNVVAVEVHNVWARNNDLSFDLGLSISDAEAVIEPTTDLISAGDEWAYTDSTDGEPAIWPAALVGAPTARSEFGFGDGDETTVLSAGADAYYFSRSFEVTDLDDIEELELGLAADDGAVVYLNGIEIHRFNMPAGPIEQNTRPITWVAGADEAFQITKLAPAALVEGTNVISVQVHNLWPGNSDLTFDLYLAR